MSTVLFSIVLYSWFFVCSDGGCFSGRIGGHGQRMNGWLSHLLVLTYNWENGKWNAHSMYHIWALPVCSCLQCPEKFWLPCVLTWIHARSSIWPVHITTSVGSSMTRRSGSMCKCTVTGPSQLTLFLRCLSLGTKLKTCHWSTVHQFNSCLPSHRVSCAECPTCEFCQRNHLFSHRGTLYNYSHTCACCSCWIVKILTLKLWWRLCSNWSVQKPCSAWICQGCQTWPHSTSGRFVPSVQTLNKLFPRLSWVTLLPNNVFWTVPIWRNSTVGLFHVRRTSGGSCTLVIHKSHLETTLMNLCKELVFYFSWTNTCSLERQWHSHTMSTFCLLLLLCWKKHYFLSVLFLQHTELSLWTHLSHTKLSVVPLQQHSWHKSKSQRLSIKVQVWVHVQMCEKSLKLKYMLINQTRLHSWFNSTQIHLSDEKSFDLLRNHHKYSISTMIFCLRCFDGSDSAGFVLATSHKAEYSSTYLVAAVNAESTFCL